MKKVMMLAVTVMFSGLLCAAAYAAANETTPAPQDQGQKPKQGGQKVVNTSQRSGISVVERDKKRSSVKKRAAEMRMQQLKKSGN